jgi:hypothetical protein
MTLNLMLTSPTSAYLSGDFRLSTPDGRRWQDDLNAQKLVPVIKSGWCALVSFAGLAGAPPRIRDVGDWLAQQMHAISWGDQFDEVPRRLLEANSWLTAIPARVPLTFSVVAFVRRHPIALIISNCLDVGGKPLARPLPQLVAHAFKPSRPEVRVIGDHTAVTARDVDRLQLLLTWDSPKREKELHETIAKTNASAARRSGSISPECVTGRLSALGGATIVPHGINEQVEYIPGFVRRFFSHQGGALPFTPKADEQGKPLPVQWRQMAVQARPNYGKGALPMPTFEFSNVLEPATSETPPLP